MPQQVDYAGLSQLPANFDPRVAQMQRYQLSNMRTETEANKLKLAEARQQADETANIRALFARNPNPSISEVAEVSPQFARQYATEVRMLRNQDLEEATKYTGLMSAAFTNIEQIPEAQRQQSWPSVRQNLVSMGVPAERLPEQYDPNVIAPFADQIKLLDVLHKKEAETRNLAEEQRKIAEEQRRVAEAEQKKSKSEYELRGGAAEQDFQNFYASWLAANNAQKNSAKEYKARIEFKGPQRAKVPGVDYPLPADVEEQRGRINRSRGNPYLNQLREFDIASRAQAAPGQIIYKTSRLPVPTSQVGNEAASKVADYNNLLDSVGEVRRLIGIIGSTGAIKGWILRDGVHWPAVQQAITPDQAEAVAEILRLNRAYVYAVSGKQITEREAADLARTTPSVRFTPEANQSVLNNFERFLKRGRANYLDVRGWSLKEIDVPDTAGADETFRMTGPDGTFDVPANKVTEFEQNGYRRQ